MLTNFDIERIAKKLDLPIVGVFSKNELLNTERKVGSYYINLMDDDKTDAEGNNGSHWVMAKIYCDEDRENYSSDEEETKGHKVCNALYFDAFGFGMPKAVASFLKPFKPIYCNNREIQNINTSQCGWYCLACDYALEHLQYSDTYLGDYEKFIEMWSSDPKKNLAILKKFFKPL
jgi:hypothetical protein